MRERLGGWADAGARALSSPAAELSGPHSLACFLLPREAEGSPVQAERPDGRASR